MPYIPDQQINTGSYVESTAVWDVGLIQDVDVTSPEFKELLVRLYQNINNIVLALNTKDSAFYLNEEFVNGSLFFNPLSSSPLELRAGFRKVINLGPLAAGAKAVNHGLSIPVTNVALTNAWKFVKINGAASNTTLRVYYPLPFAGAAGNNIEISLTATQVLVNNASGVVFTDAYVVLEYVKN